MWQERKKHSDFYPASWPSLKGRGAEGQAGSRTPGALHFGIQNLPDSDQEDCAHATPRRTLRGESCEVGPTHALLKAPPWSASDFAPMDYYKLSLSELSGLQSCS